MGLNLTVAFMGEPLGLMRAVSFRGPTGAG